MKGADEHGGETNFVAFFAQSLPRAPPTALALS
jgi:hypothetical protein